MGQPAPFVLSTQGENHEQQRLFLKPGAGSSGIAGPKYRRLADVWHNQSAAPVLTKPGTDMGVEHRRRADVWQLGRFTVGGLAVELAA